MSLDNFLSLRLQELPEEHWLVPGIRARGFRDAEEWEVVSLWRARELVERRFSREPWVLREFVQRTGLLGPALLFRVQDDRLRSQVAHLLERGDLAVVRRVGARKRASATPEAGIAVRVMGAAKLLPLDGTNYRVIPSSDCAEILEGGGFQVVRVDEARVVLKRIAGAPTTSQGQKTAIDEADDLLTDKSARPGTLFLLRKTPTIVERSEDASPAFSPSQLRKVADEKPPDQLFDVELERLYHDNEPLQRAPFLVELEDGSTVDGTLNAFGRASLKDLPSRPVRVRFEPDARPYERVDRAQNPMFKEKMSAADIDALIERNLGGRDE